MRLLHCLDTLDPAFGGTVESVRQLASCLALTDHQMEVLSLDAPECSWADTWPVPVHTLGPYLTVYRYTPRLVPWLQANVDRFDAVVVNGVWRYPTVGVWRALRRHTVPFFVIPHGMLSPWFKRAFPVRHLKKSLFWKIAEHRCLRDAAAVLFTCETEKAEAPRHYSPWNVRSEVVNLGVATDGRPDLAAAKDAFFDRRPELRDRRLLVFIGRLVQQKACDIIIEAFAKSELHRSGFHLLMVGPDSRRWQSALQALAKREGVAGRITWTGPLYGAEKWGALTAAELFVCPSRFEAFPIAVLEALSLELPVVVSRNVNIWREIVDGSAGLACECTVASVAAAFASWEKLSASARSTYRASAGELFRSRFDVRISAERHIQMLGEYIGRRDRSETERTDVSVLHAGKL